MAVTGDASRILIIGAGHIAGEYVKALRSLGYTHISVLSRREAAAREFCAEHGLENAFGGGEEALAAGQVGACDAYIVASPVETLAGYAELLAKKNARRVLLEKPAFLYSAGLESFMARYPSWNASVALNRLYYPSVSAVREAIQKEGITSAEFSFTEWVHRIHPQDYTPITLARWGLSDCIHVIATASDLIGLPRAMVTQQHGAGCVAWHPSASIFTGSGVSENEVPFVYHSDWNSAGRWWINIRTPRGNYSLCPMEGLEFNARGTLNKEILVPAWSESVKCGFREMLCAWLQGGKTVMLKDLLPHMRAVERIFGYQPEKGQ